MEWHLRLVVGGSVDPAAYTGAGFIALCTRSRHRDGGLEYGIPFDSRRESS